MEGYPTYLIHYGIPGQKWGVRRWQYEDGSLTPEGYIHYGIKNLEKSRTANLDKWGKSENDNILYITGYSGSGKSTVASMLKNKNVKVIHLDGYLSPMSKKSANELQNKEFNNFLDKRIKDWRKVIKEDGKLDYKKVDQIAKATEEWSKLLYKQNKKIILEGVQLMDTTFYENRSFYKNKPYMLLGTSALESWKRGNERDEMRGLDRLYRFKYYVNTSKTVSQVSKELELKKNKNLNNFLKQYGNTKIK